MKAPIYKESAMKTILAPIDYSENSQNALTYAFHVAKAANAEVILFHAFYPIVSPPAAYDVTDVILALEEAKARELAEFAEKTKRDISPASEAKAYKMKAQAVAIQPSDFADVKISCVTRMGGSYEQILKAIEEYNADLVVMGMQGGEVIRQALLGSTTISVMQESRVPVLAVPHGIPFRQFESVVFAADLGKMPATADLRMLRDFVKEFNARLQVLHLHQNSAQQASFDGQKALEMLTGKLQDINFSVSLELQKDIAKGIQQYINEKQADLLVMIPQKHNIFERLLDRSITGKITAHPLVPLLALPAGCLLPTEEIKEEEHIGY